MQPILKFQCYFLNSSAFCPAFAEMKGVTCAASVWPPHGHVSEHAV